MYKLLKANFFRLVKNKIFWGIVIITILIASFILLNTILNHQGEIKAGIDNILIMYINFIGIFIAMFTSLFVGTEYSDGALRNKIVIGHSRKHIYFANMMTSIVVGICIIPILKLTILTIAYKILAAVTEPIADGKIVDLLEQIGDVFKIFLAILCSLSVLLIIGTALVLKISNTGMMYR